MKLYAGTSGFAYKEWRGIFYPEKIQPGKMLAFYSEKLNAVEVNYTFYHMPTEKVLAPWREEVPEDFAFAIKAPRMITHFKRLKHVDEEADYFFKTLLTVLGGKLGPVLMQFPENFHADRARLETFLGLIPEKVRCAFEFRSESWHEAGIYDLLRESGHTLCTADTDEAPATDLHGEGSWGYLRLRRSDYGEAELSAWAKRVRELRWETAFVFFKHEDEARGPGEAIRFRELFCI